jgi:hypothetical protein
MQLIECGMTRDRDFGVIGAARQLNLYASLMAAT